MPVSVPGFLFASPNYQLSLPLSPIFVVSSYCHIQSTDLCKNPEKMFYFSEQKEPGSVSEKYHIMYNLDKFCIRRHDFKENLTSSFGGLRDDHDFTDVTLDCNGGTFLEAHKVVLASSSAFFGDFLKKE